jgi:hypothetical protein
MGSQLHASAALTPKKTLQQTTDKSQDEKHRQSTQNGNEEESSCICRELNSGYSALSCKNNDNNNSNNKVQSQGEVVLVIN